MKKFNILIVPAACLLILSSAVNIPAQEKPVQISLFNPVQLYDETTSITGLRINLLYGKNTKITGLDFGLVNHTTSGVSKGVQFGVVGIADDDFTGWQDNFVNITKRHFEGLQWGFVNYAGTMSGVQIGLINYAANMTKGLQIGLVNIIKQGGQFPFFPIVNWAF
ncbi:MAG: hypothetical protein JW995_15775 [Melioribacteraceae bacterium]|nr:hypothetical protein [Melioribacteraceae bacterium]